MAEFDYKEFARQMRENAVKDHNGNIICSPELWEQIAGIIERTPQQKQSRLGTGVQTMADKEYIEREAVRKMFEDDYNFDAATALDRIPAADVVEIPESGIGNLSDGYHTFNELYHHRAMLFSVICNLFPDKAWKSKLHDTGDMYEGMFIVGIETPNGQATYHYDIEPCWDIFNVKELEKAPKWDGHTPKEAIDRIATLSAADVVEVRRGRWVSASNKPGTNIGMKCSLCGARIKYSEFFNGNHNFCHKCGADMRGKTNDNRTEN